MNPQQQEQFYQMMSRCSRAASTSDARITEMINCLLVSKPIKKEPEIIDLQEYAKSAAASIPGINKMKVIAEFLNGKHN